MKVSFDFDETLELPHVQEYAKELINKGIDVWIITSRYDDEHWLEVSEPIIKMFTKENYLNPNDYLKEIATKVGVPLENIVFTNMKYKAEFITKEDNIIWHLEDNINELAMLTLTKVTEAIDVTSKDWKDKCNSLLGF